MTEESLNELPLEELIATMVKSVNELLAMNKAHESITIVRTKQREVEMMQRVIRDKQPPTSKDINFGI